MLVLAFACLLNFFGQTYWLARSSDSSVPRLLFFGLGFPFPFGRETRVAIQRDEEGNVDRATVHAQWFSNPAGEFIAIDPARTRDGLWAPTHISGPSMTYFPAPTVITRPRPRSQSLLSASVPEDCVVAVREALASESDTKVLRAFDRAMSSPEGPGGHREFVEIIPIGYVHNVVALALVLAFPIFLRLALREFKAGKRLKRHTCPKCTYPLVNLRECRCPECGWEPPSHLRLAPIDPPGESRPLASTPAAAVGTV